jgi:transposase
LGRQVRGLLRPFGIRLPSRVGAKKFAEAAYEATKADPLIHTSIAALLEALASLDAQVAKLDDGLEELARVSEIAWRLMSIPGVGPVTVLAFIATIEDVRRFKRMPDTAPILGAYLGLTGKRYQSAGLDIRMDISKQGDAMARHYLYEAANVLLTTVNKRFALRGWGLRLITKLGPKQARVAVARKLAVLMRRMWKDGVHFDAVAAG